MADRKELRKERYRYLRSLGFSSADARRMRDKSLVNIDSEVDTERERITRIHSTRRSEQEKERVRLIRAERRRKPTVESKTRFQTEKNRLELFKSWTKNRNFPNWASTYIAKENRKAKLDPLNSYGYRRFYYRFVKNMPESQAAIRADRDDS